MSYSPTLGRWVQQDPAGYVDGMSLYEAVRSSPATMVDPDGLDASYGMISGGGSIELPQGGTRGGGSIPTQNEINSMLDFWDSPLMFDPYAPPVPFSPYGSPPPWAPGGAWWSPPFAPPSPPINPGSPGGSGNPFWPPNALWPGVPWMNPGIPGPECPTDFSQFVDPATDWFPPISMPQGPPVIAWPPFSPWQDPNHVVLVDNTPYTRISAGIIAGLLPGGPVLWFIKNFDRVPDHRPGWAQR